MHIVECPSCSAVLKVAQPVSNARLKCRKCGVVFSGTSHEAQESAPAPVPIPASRPMGSPFTYRPVVPAKNNNVVYITIGIGVVLVGLIIAVVVRLNSRNEKPAEAPQAQAPAPVRTAPPAPPSDLFPTGNRPTPPRPAPESPAPEPTTPRPAPVELSSPGPVAPRPANPSSPAPPATPPAPVLPENLAVECQVARIGLPGSELLYLKGGVRNDRAEGLRSVTVEIRVPDGSKTKLTTIVCSLLAPQQRLFFLVPCPTPLEEGTVVPAVATAFVPLDPKQVCWAVSDAVVKGEDTTETRIITGTARNPRDTRVFNVEVYADVYFADGRPAGTTRGKLEHGDSLDPGGRDDFTLPFNAGAVGTRMQRPIVRVLGTVP